MRFDPIRATLPLLAAVLFLGTACKPRMIPGTEIADTPDDRALLDLAARYRDAFCAKDAAGILALASPRYLDARDSISYDSLKAQLQDYFDKVKQVHLDITVRRVAVEGNHARMDYVYSINYLLSTVDPQWRSRTDDKRMTLEREGSVWKVTSGF